METIWQFIAVAGTAASIAGAILAWQARDTRKLLDRIDARHAALHATTQGMLERMDQGHRTLLQEMDQRWHATHERLDRAAEQRQAELKALLERR